MENPHRPIYLDYNATTPHDPEVVDSMRPFLETGLGNPSSAHAFGVGPREAVSEARRHVAALGGAKPEEIARIASRNDVLVHTDAAQSLGKIPVDVGALSVDMLTIAGHKLYAPKGVGALYIKRGTHPERIMYGGGQERGCRPRTENGLEIVGLGAACRVAARDLQRNAATMRRTRELLYKRLSSGCDAKLNGPPELRLPNTLNLSFRGVTSEVTRAWRSLPVAA
jgi:cysteine desulfurase